MDFVSFDDSKSMEDFFKNQKVQKEDKIEYYLLDQYKNNKILFTAEHAFNFRIPKPEFGERAFIGVGDRNTDKLAKLMAYSIKSGFLISNIPRTEADAARPIESLGKDEKLLVAIVKDRKVLKKCYLPIHQNIEYLPLLEKYHKIVDNLNPRMIVSIHGIQRRHEPDIVLGVGKDFSMVGGKQAAEDLKKIIREGIKKTRAKDLKIKFSKKYLTGEKNYTLWRHVIQYNKNKPEKKFGMQVEFNMRGRIVYDDKELIRKKYQITAQVIASSILEWLNIR